jgi:pimeloyl-ACP methyl ester carboxylesterase
MSHDSGEIVLPRSGQVSSSPRKPIPGPSEEVFTKTFGKLLPPAKYVQTGDGKAAYYELLPSSDLSAELSSEIPARVLLVHGVQTPALGMFPLARALKTSFPHTHFVLVDLWGHGLSDTPIVAHDPSLFHRLLDALLDRLEWHLAHLVGYSFGGALTVGYVASRSSRVQSFTLVAPAGLIRSSDYTAEELGKLRGNDASAARKWVMEFLEGGELVVPADWKEKVSRGEVVAEAIRAWQAREHLGNTASVVAIIRDGGVMDNDAEFVRAVRTGIPSIAILGEMDDVCNERDLKELGFADVAVVPQVGHGVVRERAPEVARLIGDFWLRISKSTTR